MNASQIEVGIGRWKSVEMSTADRGEQQRIGMGGDLLVKSGVDVHGSSSESAARRAFTSRAFACS